MSRKTLLWLLATVFLTTAFPARAQQEKKSFRLGLLVEGSRAGTLDRLEVLRDGLRQHGYVDGKHYVLEQRYAEGNRDRLSELAADLVRIRADIIVANTRRAAQAAKQATNAIPIVMVNAADPIDGGLIASFARPGGNVTGTTNYSPELLGKRLELLKDSVPKVRRVGILYDSTSRGTTGALKEREKLAQVLNLRFLLMEVSPPNPNFENAFSIANKERAGALIVSPGALISSRLTKVIELAAKNRLPAMYPRPSDVEMGGLMAYGVEVKDLWRRAAVYIDKIQKGANPADLPVEHPMKFELVFNLKTAKQIGLTIPQSVLYRADRVIK